jgi:hypothetical protein
MNQENKDFMTLVRELINENITEEEVLLAVPPGRNEQKLAKALLSNIKKTKDRREGGK